MLVNRVTNNKGTVLQEFRPKPPEQGLPLAAAQTLLDVMRGVIERGTGAGIRSRFGIEGDLALFGEGPPTTALMWIRDASVPTTDAAFDAFASGFDAGIGQDASLDRSGKSNETVDGVTYVCAPVVGAATGTICMWQDDAVFWLLFEFSGQGQTAARSLAVVAHDAVETA